MGARPMSHPNNERTPMCTVSMVGDHYQDVFKRDHPWVSPGINTGPIFNPSTVSVEEFEALKKEVENMRALLIRAKIYDEENDEPHCEVEEKVELLRRVAELVGVNLKDVL